MEFHSVHGSPHPNVSAPSLRDSVTSNFDLFAASPFNDFSVGIASTSSDEANENFASFDLLGGIKFVSCLIGVATMAYDVGNFLYKGAVELKKKAQYECERIDYIVTNSKETWWDASVWEEKLDNDKVDFALNLASISNEVKVDALGEPEKDKLVNSSVQKLLGKLKELPPGADEASGKVVDFVSTRKELLEDLDCMPPTIFSRILKGFVSQSHPDDPAAPLTFNEKKIISKISDAILVEHKREAKQYEAREKAYLQREQTCPSPNRLDEQRKRLKAFKSEYKDLEAKRESTTDKKKLAVLDAKAEHNLAMQDKVQAYLESAEKIRTQWLKKEYEKLEKIKEKNEQRPLTNKEKLELNSKALKNRDAYDELSKSEYLRLNADKPENRLRQKNLLRAEYLQLKCFASWILQAYNLGNEYLKKKLESRFTPNYSETSSFKIFLGIRAGWKNPFKTPAKAFVETGIGVDLNKTTSFTDPEGYSGSSYNSYEIALEVLGQVSALLSDVWKALGISDAIDGLIDRLGIPEAFKNLGISGWLELNLMPRSLFAEYREHGTPEKISRQQFHNKDNIRKKLNVIEFADQWIDSLAIKYRHDPKFKEFTSRESGLGLDTNSYQHIHTWDEVGYVDLIKRQLDAMQESLQEDRLLDLNSISPPELENTEVQKAVEEFSTSRHAENEKIQALKKAQVKSVMKDFADFKLEELKWKRQRTTENVLKDIKALKQQKLLSLEATVKKPNIDSKDKALAQEALNDKIKEFYEHQIALEKFINENGRNVSHKEIYLAEDKDDKTNKEINQLVNDALFYLRETEEEKQKRYSDLDMEIQKQQAQSWKNKFELEKNELRVDLAFELMSLKGKQATEAREQLINQWKAAGWESGFAYIFTHEQLNEYEAHPEDDEKVKKIVYTYNQTLAEIDAEIANEELRLQHEADVAEIEHRCDAEITITYQELVSLTSNAETKSSAQTLEKANKKAEQEFDRDFEIRKRNLEFELALLKNKQAFALATANKQSELAGQHNRKADQINREFKLEKLNKTIAFDINELKHDLDFHLAEGDRRYKHNIGYGEKKDAQKDRDWDEKRAVLEYVHAIKLKEKESELKERRSVIEALHSSDHQVSAVFLENDAKRKRQLAADKLRLKRDLDIGEIDDALEDNAPIAEKKAAAVSKVSIADKCDKDIQEIETAIKMATPDEWKKNKLEELASKYEIESNALVKQDSAQAKEILEENYQLEVSEINALHSKLSSEFKEQARINLLRSAFEKKTAERRTSVDPKKQHELHIDDLKFAQLISLLPLKSSQALKEQAILLKELELDDVYFPAEFEENAILAEDEAQAKEIIALSQFEIQAANLKFTFDSRVQDKNKQFGNAEAMLEELELEPTYRSNRTAAFNKVLQAKDEAKATKDEQERDYSKWGWESKRKKSPTNFINTDAPINGCYKTDYYTGYGSIGAGGQLALPSDSLSINLQGSAKVKYIRLSRQKPTHFGMWLTDPNKPPEFKDGMKKRIAEQLDSIVQSASMAPMSRRQAVIDGWKELTFSLVSDAQRTEPRKVSRVFNPKTQKYEDTPTEGFTVSDQHFTIEQCLKCIETDRKLYAKCYDENGIKAGYEAAFQELMWRWRADEPWEVIKFMAYFVGELVGMADKGPQHQVLSKVDTVTYTSKKNITALENKLKVIESKLPKLIAEKDMHWMEWMTQEFGGVFVESAELKGSAMAAANADFLAAQGEYGGGVTYTNRHHPVASRTGYNKEPYKITGRYSGLGYIPGAVNQQIVGGFNGLIGAGDGFEENPLSALSGYRGEARETVRYIFVPRFTKFYNELNRPQPEWTEAYSWGQTTVEQQSWIGGDTALDNLNVIEFPLGLILKFGPYKSETNMVSEKFSPYTYNHFDMFYSHGVDIGDLNKHWRTIIYKGQQASIKDLFTNRGRELFEENYELMPLANELAVRTLEYRRSKLLDPSKFWEFDKATKKIRTVSSYFYAIRDAAKDLKELEKKKSEAFLANNEVQEQYYDDKIEAIRNTLSLARRYFLENGLNPDDPNSCYDHVFQTLEAWEASYYPHVRKLFMNSPFQAIATVGVDGVRQPVYDKEKLNGG